MCSVGGIERPCDQRTRLVPVTRTAQSKHKVPRQVVSRFSDES